MPSLELSTNVRVPDKDKLMRTLSACVCRGLGKAETYMLVKVQDEQAMFFGGNAEPVAHMTLRAMVFKEEAMRQLAEELTAIMHDELGVESQRVSMVFMDSDLSKWAWDGRPFA